MDDDDRHRRGMADENTVFQEVMERIDQESKNIDDTQNAINIAKSVLNTQYTVSGNNKILSPFD